MEKLKRFLDNCELELFKVEMNNRLTDINEKKSNIDNISDILPESVLKNINKLDTLITELKNKLNTAYDISDYTEVFRDYISLKNKLKVDNTIVVVEETSDDCDSIITQLEKCKKALKGEGILTDKINDLEKKLLSCNFKNVNLENEAKTMQNKVKDLLNENEKYKNLEAKCRENIVEMQTRIKSDKKDCTKEKNDLNYQIKEYENTLKELTEELIKNTEELENDKKDCIEEKKNLEAELDKKLNEIKTIETKLSDTDSINSKNIKILNDEKNKLEGVIRELQNKNDELENKANELQTQMINLQSDSTGELNKLRDEKNVIQTEMTNKSSQISELEKKIKDMETKLSDSNSNNAITRTMYLNASKEATIIRKNLELLKNKLLSYEDEIEKMQVEIEKCEKLKIRYKENTDDIIKLASECEAKYDDLDKKYTNIVDKHSIEVKNLNDEIEKIKKSSDLNISDKDNKIKTLNKELEKCGNNINKVRQEYENDKKSFNAVEEKYQTEIEYLKNKNNELKVSCDTKTEYLIKRREIANNKLNQIKKDKRESPGIVSNALKYFSVDKFLSDEIKEIDKELVKRGNGITGGSIKTTFLTNLIGYILCIIILIIIFLIIFFAIDCTYKMLCKK